MQSPMPAPQPKQRNWIPLIAGGCGCLVLLGAFAISALIFAGSQGILPMGGTVTAAPTIAPTARAQPTAPPNATTAPPGGSRITNAVMAKDTKGDNKDPVDVTDAYAPTQRVFHSVVSVADLPANTKIKAVWYAVDVGSVAPPNSKIDEFELTTEGTRNVDFTLTVGPSGKWPVGKYKVDIFMNGTLNRTVNFRVQ